MKELKNYLILALVSVLIGLALYSVSPVTPPVTPGTPPVVAPEKPQPIVIKTLTDYYADWCGPCKAAKSKVDELEKSGVIVKRVNADRNVIETMNAKVTSLPTFVCWRQDGDIVRQIRTQNIDEVIRFFGGK
jgi:thiol-disulfide isomerase/thioredoxin